MAGLKPRSVMAEVRGGLKDESVGFLAGKVKIIEANSQKQLQIPACGRQASTATRAIAP